MYHCSAKCCETDYYTMEEMQRCVDKCSKPINSAQNYIQTELGSFQVLRSNWDIQLRAQPLV